MNSLRQHSFYLFLIILFSQSSLRAQENIEKSIDEIFSDYQDSDRPGASVAVVKDGKIIFKKGYGSANLEYDIPNTPSTVFHIASISKQFTVFSILLLAEQGKLSFDDDIRKYIPEVPDFGKTITLRHLASHTSGMRDQWNLLSMAGWRMDDVITKEHVLKLVAKQKELNFAPGEAYNYCNTGFTLLAEVVARVSGQSFAAFTQAHIFEPLKMSNTLFYDDHQKVVKNRAYSYYYADSLGYKKSVLSYANVGATSLFTTVEDLSLWALNFSTLQVGSAAIVQQMNTLATLNNGETFGGAYGQFVDTFQGFHQIQHGGADAGYRTYLGRFPDQKIAVAVLSNRAETNPNALALSVADLFLPDPIITPSTIALRPMKERVYKKLKTKDLEQFSGDYWNEEGSYSRRIYVKNDTLRYDRGFGNESTLAPIGDTIFQMLNVGDVDLTVSFEDTGGSRNMIVIIGGGQPIVSSLYTPSNYSKEELMRFTGSFYSPELSTTYQLVIKDDQLVAEHSRLSDIKLQGIKADMFTGNSWYFGEIRFERDEQKQITGLRVSSGRVQNLLFEKVD